MDEEDLPGISNPLQSDVCEEVVLLSDSEIPGQCISENEVEIGMVENRFIPGRSRAADAICLESGCSFRCARIPKLRNHLASTHGIPQLMQTFRFTSEEGFRSWLSNMENENHCSYMRRRGWQKNKNGSETACFYCNRGGLYISNASKKQSKQQGTCKTGVECTSSLKVTRWKLPTYRPRIDVEAYLQHYGHNLELGHTRIHWRDRKLIEDKLKNGISRHKILDEIRGSLDQTSDLSRIHLVSLQDIYNIEKRCGIKANRGRYCSEAGITAQAWIEAMQQSEDNPVLLIKYQQESAPEQYSCLGEDDFLLILQTPLQLKMLQKHGPRQFMCADVTHGNVSTAAETNETKDGHEFHLFVLEVLIPDENQNKGPYPVAWCVSNRKDSEIIKVFFGCIKDNLKGFTLTPGYLFIPLPDSTEGNDWFSIWCNAFGAGPRKLISSWHIIDEWKQNLKALCPFVYASASERGRILGNLETVIREPSVEHFTKLLEECVTDLKNNELTSEFSAYFQKSYMSRAELWASAYRTEAANSADAHLDIFHRRLAKHIYHEALKRKQLDILVKTLMKYTRDNVLPKLRNFHKGKNEFHQRAFTAAAHTDSLSLSLDDVDESKDNPYEWKVSSLTEAIDEETAQVSQVTVVDTVKIMLGQGCTARLRCPLRCSDCAACPHQMSCSCMSKKEAKEAMLVNDEYMCHHMHLVCRFLHERRGLRLDTLHTITPSIMTLSDIITQQSSAMMADRYGLQFDSFRSITPSIATAPELLTLQSSLTATDSHEMQSTSFSSAMSSEVVTQQSTAAVTDVIITSDTQQEVTSTSLKIENLEEQPKKNQQDDRKRSIGAGEVDAKPIKIIKFDKIPKVIFIGSKNTQIKLISKKVS